jgi:hypothetical protein
MNRSPTPRFFAGLALCLLVGCRAVEPKVLTDFPAREAPNYQGLVSVSWLKGLLDYQKPGSQTPRPETYRNERFVGQGEGLPSRPHPRGDPFQH